MSLLKNHFKLISSSNIRFWTSTSSWDDEKQLFMSYEVKNGVKYHFPTFFNVWFWQAREIYLTNEEYLFHAVQYDFRQFLHSFSSFSSWKLPTHPQLGQMFFFILITIFRCTAAGESLQKNYSVPCYTVYIVFTVPPTSTCSPFLIFFLQSYMNDFDWRT